MKNKTAVRWFGVALHGDGSDISSLPCLCNCMASLRVTQIMSYRCQRQMPSSAFSITSVSLINIRCSCVMAPLAWTWLPHCDSGPQGYLWLSLYLQVGTMPWSWLSGWMVSRTGRHAGRITSHISCTVPARISAVFPKDMRTK